MADSDDDDVVQTPRPEYIKGAIVRVEMFQFLVYQHVNVKAGPRLNMIVGPNGTGKSTIVCAIALGLGGSPKLLGEII